MQALEALYRQGLLPEAAYQAARAEIAPGQANALCPRGVEGLTPPRHIPLLAAGSCGGGWFAARHQQQDTGMRRVSMRGFGEL